jgi:hypothetical protein
LRRLHAANVRIERLNLFVFFGVLCRSLHGTVMVAGVAMVVVRERLGDFLGGEAAVVFVV